MTYRMVVALLALVIVACTPVTDPTPTFDRAPSLAPSPTVLPIIPQENEEAFVGRSDPTSAALAAEGHPSQDPSLAPQATEQSIPFTVIAEDGTILSSRYFGAGTDTAVILLHDGDGDTSALMLLGASLQQIGFDVLVLTFRGYRPSSGQVDWSKAGDDALDGIESILTLPNVSRVAVLGVGRSAAAGMVACARHSACDALILVNPVPDGALEQAAANMSGHPLLMLVSQERTDSQQTAQIIQAGSGGTFQIFPSLAVDQLTTTTPLVEWLIQALSTPN